MEEPKIYQQVIQKGKPKNERNFANNEDYQEVAIESMIEKMDTPFEESKQLASSRDFEEPWEQSKPVGEIFCLFRD